MWLTVELTPTVKDPLGHVCSHDEPIDVNDCKQEIDLLHQICLGGYSGGH